jgi:predicted nucleotidyltransferase
MNILGNSQLIYQSIVGSQSYGLQTPTSDTDIKGVYMQDKKDLLVSGGYKPHVSMNKDEFYFELSNFLELLAVGNPTAIELLVSPEHCVLQSSAEFRKILKHKDIFFTKKLYDSFGGYALNQLKKAGGLEKKFNWEASRIKKKDILDFCKVLGRSAGRTYTAKDYLKAMGTTQEKVGLTKVEGFRDTYKFYIPPNPAALGVIYRGLSVEGSNEVRTSEVPKDYADNWFGVLYFNKESYSAHCKDYKSYKHWEATRNETRYRESREGKKYDGKNIMHTVRLVRTIEHFHHTGEFNIDMSADRDFLLDIKKGNVNLEEVILDYKKRALNLTMLKAESDLPDEVQPSFVRDLEFIIRDTWS